MKAVAIPRAPPALVTLACERHEHQGTKASIDKKTHTVPVNSPAARRANVAVRKANKAMRPRFFLREPMLFVDRVLVACPVFILRKFVTHSIMKVNINHVIK